MRSFALFIPSLAPSLLAVMTLGLLASVAVADTLLIGHLEQRGDPRYRATSTAARYLAQPLGRPYAGAELALGEIRFHGAGAGVEFALERVRGRSAKELLSGLEALHERGARFFLIDAPADTIVALAEATRGRELLLFNVSARDDRLRQEQCQAHLLHTAPNDAMLTDALVQYLVFRKWTDVLMLVGPSDADARMATAFERSANRYGVRIVERRPFVLSNDPREREENNVALLTGGAQYDVIFVADTDGEFARAVPYQSVRPRPVVGAEGLVPAAWYWAWERHGAPQLENRFEERHDRRMGDFDWAAWVAVKAVAEAVQRTGSAEFPALRDYLLDPELILDGFKGSRMNFRSWDRQLRQPLLLITHNWVVDRAPIRGFLHQSNNMDTLGFDERDSQCRM